MSRLLRLVPLRRLLTLNNVRCFKTAPYKTFTFPQTQKVGETMEAKRKRLVHRSKQRGFLELELILGTWSEKYINTLTDEEVLQYEKIVHAENPDLLNWLVNGKECPKEMDGTVMVKLREYTQEVSKLFVEQARRKVF
eukprot:TRINITY_DN1547_c2_g1_i1.p1 TRINITY_DN1547_c2_g1~~TRINITY_DN1547_c2_g1_i1.p1  ORF type:complete len:138 (-),score=22.52 TRINITY_DN1547_c2_g1_i1:291-704(-)